MMSPKLAAEKSKKPFSNFFRNSGESFWAFQSNYETRFHHDNFFVDIATHLVDRQQQQQQLQQQQQMSN